MSHDLVLTGCRPKPLAAYLKALGVLRLVAGQIDPAATGCWDQGRFRLRSRLDRDALVRFFTEEYRPTPLVAPWNGGSGFGPNDAKSSPSAVAAVAAIEGSAGEQLAPYRSTIASLWPLLADGSWGALTKEQQVARCRNALPDEALPWIDCTVVLTSAGRSFPPLLGTGGNDGRFDFSANFMQRIGELLGLVPRRRGAPGPATLLEEALFSDVDVPLEGSAIGQFDPAAAGGPAAVPFGSASAVSNPWDFVLLLEGAVLFAAGVARRLSGTADRSAVPFIVAASPAGHTTAAAEENSRGELWAPLWSRPMALAELEHLIGEGRAELGRHQAESGVTVARALASLGVDRGIDSFVRHAFVERNGLSTFAVPVGVHHAPSGSGLDLAILADLDAWADRLRRTPNPPSSLSALLRRLDDAQFAAADRRSAAACQDVLIAAARLDSLQQRSPALLERGRLYAIDAARWCPLLDDGSDELRLAVAVASLRGAAQDRTGWLRQFTSRTQRPPAIAGLGSRPIVDVLAELLVRLSLGPASAGDEPSRTPERTAQPWLVAACANRPPLRSAVRFVLGELDDRHLGDLIAAMSLLDWRERVHLPPAGAGDRPFCSPAHALLGPLFASTAWPERHRSHTAAARRGWAQMLVSGGAASVCAEALRTYRIVGLQPTVRSAARITAGVSSRRLAAGCVIPLGPSALESLLNQVAVNHRTEENHDVQAATA